jgi:DNA-binding GntR family transcriptional regulator
MQVQKIEPLHNQAYQIIKKMIMEGDFQPGQRIIEVKLANILGTSRAPIREAIRMLMQDGLIIQNDKILIVLNINSQDIVNIFEIRQSLESLTARLAANHITETKLKQIELNIRYSRTALETGDIQKLIQYDQEFHDIIAQNSNNKHLLQLYEVIKTKINFIRFCIIKNYYRNFMNFVDEHQLIYDALKAKDPIRSENEMHTHIQKNMEVSYSLYHSTTEKNN